MEMTNSNSEIKNTTKVNFRLSSRKLPYAYISSVPKGLNLVSSSESRKPNIKGISNGFRFYYGTYNYVSASFNMNDFNKIDYSEFHHRIETMFSTLHYLNERPANSLEVHLILKHIRKYSNYVFNVREMYLTVRKFRYSKSLVKIKKKDYNLVDYKLFKHKIDFLKALNNALKTVNYNNNLKDLFYLFEERIVNNDYEYLNDIIFNGHKSNNLMIYALVRKFNLLCTGLHRKARKLVNSEPLYKRDIERFTLKSNFFETQDKIVFMEKAIKKSEQKLKMLNQLVDNRQMVHQIFLIIKELTGLETDLKLNKDYKLQKQMKSELMNIINKDTNKDVLAGAKEFDRIYKKPINKYLPINTNLSDTFDTDMKNSIFNQVGIEIAQSKGEVFFGEYMRFHNKKEIIGRMNFGLICPN